MYSVIGGSTVICWSENGDPRNFVCSKCDVNIGKAVEQDEKLCDEVETVREFTHLVNTLTAG